MLETVAAGADVLTPLRRSLLVIDERIGTRRIDRVDPDGLRVLRADLERFWGKVLAGDKGVVKQPTEQGR